MKTNRPIIEIHAGEGASICGHDGEPISDKSELWSDLCGCTTTGDCQDACQYILSHYSPDFRIVKRNEAGEYENMKASPADKQAVCEVIYFESESDFSNEGTADLYIVWQAACDLLNA